MKAYTKTIYRSMRHNLGKLISIVFIVLIGITCYAGLGTLSTEVEASFNSFFNSVNLSDVNVKATTSEGFSEDEIESFREDEYISEVDAFRSLDFSNYEDNTRLYIFNQDDHQLNNLTLIDGREIEDPYTEVLVEQPSETIKRIDVGSTIKVNIYGLFTVEYTVVGVVENPLNVSEDGDYYLSDIDTSDGDDIDYDSLETLDVMIYSYEEALNIGGISFASLIPYTDLYIKFQNDLEVEYFSSSYENYIEEQVARLETKFSGSNYYYITLFDNKGYNVITEYCDKVDVIALVIPIFFLILSALVVMTSMSRMIEEERAQIGCYSSLGVSTAKIKFKYMLIAGVSTLVGAILGLVLGLTILPTVIYPGFSSLLFLPDRAYHFDLWPGIIATLIVVGITLIVTYVTINKELKNQPAVLLLPKAPKRGKKIFLEKWSWLWNKLAFRYKSSLRNIIRNPKNFWTTVLSCAFSTVIVFIGFALLDVVNYSDSTAIAGMANSMIGISVLIIALALVLTVFVVYNITNMNIGERNREIATLEVLGYHDNEVCMYIYREIALMGGCGIILGIPLGALITWLLLDYLNFGSIADVRWYTYILSGVLVVIFILIVDLMLIKKIMKIDMTTSLKSVD